MKTHAPAPYSTVEVACGAGYHAYVVDVNGRKIAAVWGPVTEKVWTAALFSASADLLASCVEFLPILEGHLASINHNGAAEASSAFQYAVGRVERMRAAITKATGEQPWMNHEGVDATV